MALQQLNFFEKTEQQALREEMESMKKSLDSIRKGLYHKNSTLAKSVDSVKCQLDDLQMQIFILEKCLK